VVLCDGHDVHGHLVARGICEELSLLLLECLTAGEDDLQLDDDENSEQAIFAAFEECERRVMWSNSMLQPNSFVRIIEGEYVFCSVWLFLYLSAVFIFFNLLFFVFFLLISTFFLGFSAQASFASFEE
jgi:hypothetical protein